MAPKPAEAGPRMDGRSFSQRSPWLSAAGAPVLLGRLLAKPPEGPIGPAPWVLGWPPARSHFQASWSCSLTFSGCCPGPGTGCGKTALPPNKVPPRPASDSSRPPRPGRTWCTPRAPHATKAHSHVLLDQQLVPDLHHQAVKVLALEGQGQVGRAPGGGAPACGRQSQPWLPPPDCGPRQRSCSSWSRLLACLPKYPLGPRRALPALEPGTGLGDASPGRAAPAPETHVVRREPRASPWPPGRRSC